MTINTIETYTFTETLFTSRGFFFFKSNRGKGRGGFGRWAFGWWAFGWWAFGWLC
tara:strand:+ start:526 stop:690 length:165 start_codon:yes stop_codon:yes gene_type:complete